MKKVFMFSLVLTMCVIMMGSYTRLSDAGLSCPDWPKCYGYLTVTEVELNLDAAQKSFPERIFEEDKAWLEMIHRYIAGTLGGLIIGMFIMQLFRHKKLEMLPVMLVTLLLFQVVLGMWTVTLNLMPIVVMGHLLGGFGIFSLLWYWFISKHASAQGYADPAIKRWKFWTQVTLIGVIFQIALGGWMAANYAATACTELPFCEGRWWENLQPLQALIGFLGEHKNYEFGVMNYDARMTIHVFHRVGAWLVAGLVLFTVGSMLRSTQSLFLRRGCFVALFLLTLQILLGVSHVFFHLPVGLGVAHNFVAALLLLSLLYLFYLLNQNKLAESV